MGPSQENLAKLRKILEELDSRLHDGKTENRRQPRIAMRIPLGILLLSGSTTSEVEVFTRNISASGIGFVSRRLFRSDERIVTPFRIPKLPAKLVLARVTFGRYLQGGLHEMGAEFLESISDPKGTSTIPKQWFHSHAPAKTAAPAPAPLTTAAPAAT